MNDNEVEKEAARWEYSVKHVLPEPQTYECTMGEFDLHLDRTGTLRVIHEGRLLVEYSASKIKMSVIPLKKGRPRK